MGAGTFGAGRRLRRIAAALARVVDVGLAAGGPAPTTNNPLESWNARPRDTPRRHRGPRLTRQLKAICRWRRQHTERPEADARPAENAITGQQLEDPYRQAWERSPQDMHETSGIPTRHGTGIDRSDSHTRVERQPND